jgi:hypothetical protein
MHQSCKKEHPIGIIISKAHSSRKYHKGQKHLRKIKTTDTTHKTEAKKNEEKTMHQ